MTSDPAPQDAASWLALAANGTNDEVLKRLIDEEYTNIGLNQFKYGLLKGSNFDVIDLNTVQEIRVAGGEPTINKDFCAFLEKCIALNKTNIKLIISTNAVSLSKRFLDLIKYFSNVRFSFSVDGFDKINYYTRYPASWEKVTSNIAQLVSITRPGNYNFNIVVSIYNITTLSLLINFLEQHYPDSFYSFSYLTDPNILEAWNHPAKDLVLDDLTNLKNTVSYRKSNAFKRKVDAMEVKILRSQVDPLKLQEFFKFNDKIDASRNIDLKDYIPELAQCRELLQK